MTTEVLVRPEDQPSTALATNDIYNYAADFLERITQPSTLISTKGKRFKLPSGEASPGPFNCVVIDFVNYNAYYADAYDPDDPQPPACWAIHPLKNSLAPNPDQVQDAQNDTCTGCDQNVWKKNERGKPYKGCRNQFRLALIDPNATLESEVYLINISPTAYKNWSTFAAKCREQGFHFRQIVCQMDWDPNKQQTLVFKGLAKHDLEPELIQALLARCTENQMLYRSPDNSRQ